MKRFYLTEEQFNNGIIDGDEFNHIKNVMRLKKCDNFVAFFGDEFDYTAEITEIKKDNLEFKVLNKTKNINNPQIKIDLFQALAKGEKLELVAQKTTEIGINSIIPLYVKNCDVKPNTTRPARLEKIIIGACKQCGRSIVPKVYPVTTLPDCIKLLDFYDLVLFANETESTNRIFDTLSANKSAKSIAIIVGPEGGFTPDEIKLIEKVSTSVTFGKRILRTETASIYLTSIVSDFYRN